MANLPICYPSSIWCFFCDHGLRKTTCSTFPQIDVSPFTETVFWPARELDLSEKMRCSKITYFYQMVFSVICYNLKMWFPRRSIFDLLSRDKGRQGDSQELGTEKIMFVGFCVIFNMCVLLPLACLHELSKPHTLQTTVFRLRWHQPNAHSLKLQPCQSRSGAKSMH